MRNAKVRSAPSQRAVIAANARRVAIIHEEARQGENMGLRNADPLLDLIETADWDDLTPRWLAYAAFRLSHYGVPERQHGKMAPDYIHRAIKEVLNREHQYRGGGLFPFVCAVVDAVMRRELGA